LTQVRIQEFGVNPAQAGAKAQSVTLTLGDDKNASKFKYRFRVQANGQASGQAEKHFGTDLLAKKSEWVVLNDTLKSALPLTEDSWKIKE
jgi:hypothetical protein